jgi:hypothetical protein
MLLLPYRGPEICARPTSTGTGRPKSCPVGTDLGAHPAVVIDASDEQSECDETNNRAEWTLE